MLNDLTSVICDAIRNRTSWEDKQRLYYEMRQDGVRRRNKPYAGAADLHCKLIDTIIEKHKPFYHQQVFNGQRLAQFVALEESSRQQAESASDYLDWVTREKTSFEREVLAVTDSMLLYGRGVMKVMWDHRRNVLCYEARPLLNIVVPSHARSLEDADCFADCYALTKAAFRRDSRFLAAAKTDDNLRRLCGGRSDDLDAGGDVSDERRIREGLTHTDDTDTVLVWEIYENTGDGWMVHFVCPVAEDVQIRPSFKLSFRIDGQPILPFAVYAMEVTDAGWYAPRGIAARLAANEQYGNKLWSTKADYLDFSIRPVWTAKGAIGNTGNVKMLPGEILPGEITPVQFPTPPLDIDAEMTLNRTIAEQSVMTPDFGIGAAGSGKENKTATEASYIQSFFSTGVEMKGRIFRLGLRDTLRAAWALILRHSQQEMVFFSAGERKVLPKQALVDSYLITPDGNPDAWSKSNRVQRAAMRFQMFRGDPSIDQDELKRDLLAADDPKLVNRLLIPSGMKAASEAEDEAFEILLLEKGYPAQARPDEDHLTRIKILLGKLEQLNALGAPVDPVAAQRFGEHLQQHIALLKEANPQAHGQVLTALQMMMATQSKPVVSDPLAVSGNTIPMGGAA